MSTLLIVVELIAVAGILAAAFFYIALTRRVKKDRAAGKHPPEE